MDTRTVRVRYIFDLDISVPAEWDQEMVEFHRNESTWCATNALAELEKVDKTDGCLCSRMRCEYVGEKGDNNDTQP